MAVDVHASTVSRQITTVPTVPWPPHSRWVEGPSKSDRGGCHQWLQHTSNAGPQQVQVRLEAGATSPAAFPADPCHTRHDAPTVIQDDQGSQGGATMEHRHWQGGPVFSRMKGYYVCKFRHVCIRCGGDHRLSGCNVSNVPGRRMEDKSM